MTDQVQQEEKNQMIVLGKLLYLLELAKEMVQVSLGSSHTRRLPQSRLLAASRFCRVRDTIVGAACGGFFSVVH